MGFLRCGSVAAVAGGVVHILAIFTLFESSLVYSFSDSVSSTFSFDRLHGGLCGMGRGRRHHHHHHSSSASTPSGHSHSDWSVPLEVFDGVGAPRTTYGSGSPAQDNLLQSGAGAAVTVPGLPSGSNWLYRYEPMFSVLSNSGRVYVAYFLLEADRDRSHHSRAKAFSTGLPRVICMSRTERFDLKRSILGKSYGKNGIRVLPYGAEEIIGILSGDDIRALKKLGWDGIGKISGQIYYDVNVGPRFFPGSINNICGSRTGVHPLVGSDGYQGRYPGWSLGIDRGSFSTYPYLGCRGYRVSYPRGYFFPYVACDGARPEDGRWNLTLVKKGDGTYYADFPVSVVGTGKFRVTVGNSLEDGGEYRRLTLVTARDGDSQDDESEEEEESGNDEKKAKSAALQPASVALLLLVCVAAKVLA